MINPTIQVGKTSSLSSEFKSCPIGQSEYFDCAKHFHYKYGYQPSMSSFEDGFFWMEKIINEFAFKNGMIETLHIFERSAYNYGNTTLEQAVWQFKADDGTICFIAAENVNELVKPSKYYNASKDFRKEFRKVKNSLSCEGITLFAPNTLQDLHNSFKKIVASALLMEKPRKIVEREDDEVRISVIVPHRSGGFRVRTVPISFSSSDEQLSLFYGKDFTLYHETLISRFKEGTKGIALFHGYPGTGKTSYIRHLAKSLNDMGKRVLFLPAAVFNQIGTPEFTSFMLDEFGRSEEGTVFILEDAETLLKQRENSSEADKVSNLLNLGDGILNDLFKIQIIATFNTELQNIDQAFLRSGRLLARKEFKKLTLDEAKLLAKHLEVEKGQIESIEKGLSLAEVFALKQNKEDNILIETHELG